VVFKCEKFTLPFYCLDYHCLINLPRELGLDVQLNEVRGLFPLDNPREEFEASVEILAV
jgi:hypothetical protein